MRIGHNTFSNITRYGKVVNGNRLNIKHHHRGMLKFKNKGIQVAPSGKNLCKYTIIYHIKHPTDKFRI